MNRQTPEPEITWGVSASKPCRRSSQWLLALLLLTVVGLLGFWVGYRRQSTAYGGLIVKEENLDFGDVWVQEAFGWQLSVYNPTGQDIEVLDLRSSCNCSSIEPKSFVVPAGGETDIRLVLDLKDPDAEPRRRFLRDFVVEVLPVTKDVPPGPTGWRLHGRVRDAIALIRSPVEFDNAMLRGEPYPTGLIQIETHVPLRTLNAECDRSSALVGVIGESPHGRAFELAVTPQQTLPAGRFRFPIQLQAKTLRGETLPPITIHAAGRIVNDIYALPSSIDFGMRAKLELCEETVTFQSRTGVEFMIEQFEATAGDIELEPQTTDFAAYHTVRIVARFDGTGQKSTLIHASTRTRSDKSLTLSLRISAYLVDASSRQPGRQS